MSHAVQRVTTAEKALHDQENILPRRQVLVVFATLSATLLISFFDQNGISVMLPTIAADLNAEDTISWAGTSSLLANTTFQMLYGRLSDIFGRKNVFLAAVGLLALADLLCGLSQNAAMLYFFRGVAGIGGGGIANLAMIIVSDVVTLEQRGKYMGIIGATVGLGNVGGPFLAAAFVEHANWRDFFYLLAPLSVLSGVIAWYFLPDMPRPDGFRESAKKIDYAGSLTSSLGVIFLLIPISGGGAYFPWDSALVISLLVVGTVLLVAFLLIEWKVAKLPMMPLNTFRSIPISTMMVQTFLLGAVYQGYIYYVPLYLLNARRFSPTVAAGISCTMVATQSISSILSGQYISRRKRYGELLWIGFSMWTLGAGLTLLYDRTSSPGMIVGPLIISGVGVGFTFQPTLVAIQAHSPKVRRAVVISNRNVFRCGGGAVGLAISAAMLQATLRGRLPPGYEHLANSTYSVPIDLIPPGRDLDLVLDAYMAASRAVFLLQVPLIGLCVVGCILVRDRGLELPEASGDEETVLDEGVGEGLSQTPPSQDRRADTAQKV